MNVPLLVAAVLAAMVGCGHSYLGERWILLPLFRDAQLPRTPVGDVWATRAMIRFTWHFFSVIAWCVAALFVACAAGIAGASTIALVLAVFWAVFAAAVWVMSRGRHGAWVLGALIAATAWWGA